MTATAWAKVEEAFARHDQYRVLAPALVAMRKLAGMIQQDAAFADAEPLVSHVSLRLGRGRSKRDVWVSWHEGNEYVVQFCDPPLELSGRRVVREDEVLRVLREYVDSLDDG